jgi:hypothetical protein
MSAASERTVQDPLELMRQGLGVRPVLCRFREGDDRVLAVWIRLGAREHAARAAALGLVERDPVQPRRELRPFLKTSEAPPRAEKHLLCNLVGLLFAEAEAPERPEDTRRVHRDQLREGILVPGTRSPNKLMLRDRRGTHRAVIPREEPGATPS